MRSDDRWDPERPGSGGGPVDCPTGGCGLLRGRRGVLLWGLLLGALLYAQWPVLKGLYYRGRGVSAPASAVAWRTDFDAALAEAARTGKPVLLDFSASWCPPCQVMKHEVWPDPEVGRAAADYVAVLVDVDDPRNAEVAGRYAVRGVPTLLVVDADGNVLREATFLSRDGLLEFLSADS